MSIGAANISSHKMLSVWNHTTFCKTIAPDQGLIPQGQHLQAQPISSGYQNKERGTQDKIQECNPSIHRNLCPKA
eukprot:1092220-Prorocentrum_lima.AAC.1